MNHEYKYMSTSRPSTPVESSSARIPSALFTLPTDLQLCILQTWLGNEDAQLLVTLSAMDIACSNRSLRQQLRFLASHPSHRWRHAAGVRTKDASSYMAWLASREVAVKTLYLCEDNAHGIAALALQGIRLAHVQELVLQFMGMRDIPVIHAALKLCPNITSIDGYCINAIVPRIWEVLALFPAVRLKTLKLSGVTYATLNAAWPLTASAQLRTLKLHGIILTDDIVVAFSLCKDLGDLTFEAKSISLAKILCVVKQCSQLSELTLESFGGTMEDIKAIVLVGSPRLKAFHCYPSWQEKVTLQQLTDLIAGFLWLDELTIGHHRFKRSCHSLQLDLVSCQVSEEAIAHLSTACGRITSLTLLVGGGENPEADGVAGIFTAVGLHFGGHLEELTLHHLSSEIQYFRRPDQLFAYCPYLKKATLTCATLTDQDLERIGSSCPLLQGIRFTEGKTTECMVSDTGMEALFAGCPDLKDVHVGHAPNITFRTLQAIVQHKLRLDKFTWLSAGFDEDVYFMLKSKSLERFRELVKEQQLLPIPLMEKEMDLEFMQINRAAEFVAYEMYYG